MILRSLVDGIRTAVSGINLTGILGIQGRIQKAWWGRGVGRGYLSSLTGSATPEEIIFQLKWRVLAHYERYFCPCPRQKNVEFSTWSEIWRTLKMYFWEIVNTLLRVMGLVSFLLRCNASNLVLEILKHGKIWETVCISVSPLQILGGDSSPRDICPWLQFCSVLQPSSIRGNTNTRE